MLVFSFYAAGPFMVGDLPGLGFGWIGLAIAIAGSLGALLNRRLPRTWNSARRVRLGLALAAVGYAEGLYWALPALPIFVGFGVAIPNLLGPALHAYDDCRGRAGALFGLAYYLLIGLGLGASTLLAAGGVLEPARPGRTAAGQAAAGMKAAPGTPVQTGRPARKAG